MPQPFTRGGRRGVTLAAMEVYGLTGGIGSGKSTVAEMLEEYGIPVVSADELSRLVVAPGSSGLADVVDKFGSEVLDDKGELDRKKMGQIVFTTPERRRQLEAILHPRIRERYEQVLDALEKAGHSVMVYEVPLLFEKKLDQQDEMKGVILVTATNETRIARVRARDALTTDDVLARMRAQMPEQEKRARADYIIHNDGDLDDLRREVEYLISRFLRLPPRAEDEIEVEPELIDESEIDTLSPEEVEETPTADLSLRPGHRAEGKINAQSAAATAGVLDELALPPERPDEPAVEPARPAPKGPKQSQIPTQAHPILGELEVELAPTPAPAVAPAPAPAVAPPAVVAGPPPATAPRDTITPPRSRARAPAKVPQFSLPLVPDATGGDGEGKSS
jgi:dephospho-CoA kinase